MDEKAINFNNAKNGSIMKSPVSVKSEKVELNGVAEEDNETVSLLATRKGGLSKKSEKRSLKVQWNDKDGNKLAEVLEFQPSDESDSDDEESDSCVCAIM
ncbi:hypothetical protein NMG60_11031930 [Bertholletia excelsa]